jgi:hypothetical protein
MSAHGTSARTGCSKMAPSVLLCLPLSPMVSLYDTSGRSGNAEPAPLPTPARRGARPRAALDLPYLDRSCLALTRPSCRREPSSPSSSEAGVVTSGAAPR